MLYHYLLAIVACALPAIGSPVPPSYKLVKKHGASALHRRDTSVATLTSLVTEYLIEVSVGTPGQTVYVAIDTGSGDTWVISSDADAPQSSYGTFDVSSSSTLKWLNNDFNITYSDGTSSNGFYASETIQVGNFTLDNFTLAVANQTSLEDGYMGLGLPGVESTNLYLADPYTYPNLIQAMKNAGLIDRAAFSLYLNGVDQASGALVFGGYDTAKYSGDFVTLPIWNSGTKRVTDTAFEYTAKLDKISLDGSAASNSTQALLFDSGASLSYFQPEVINALVDLLGATYSDDDGVYECSCSAISAGEHTLTFSFDGATFSIDPYDLLIPIGEGISGNFYCVVGAVPSSSTSRSILGDSVLRSLYVIFDQDALELRVATAVSGATGSDIVAFDAYASSTSSTSSTTSPTSSSAGSVSGVVSTAIVTSSNQTATATVASSGENVTSTPIPGQCYYRRAI